MTHWIDFKRHYPKARWFWAEEEDQLIREDQPVLGRSRKSCKWRRRIVGLGSGRNCFAKAAYELPKHVPGELPSPKWWGRAQRMRKEGYTATEIGRLLNRDTSSVYYAIYPKRREANRIKQRGYDRVRREQAEYRAAMYQRLKMVDHQRSRVRAMARDEWRASGGKPDDLEKLYRRYECL